MRFKENRRDFLDRLKFLPLDRAEKIYLTLSGELRARVVRTSKPNLKRGAGQPQNLLRLVSGADLPITKYFRAYGELAHGGISGENISTPQTTARNRLLFQQYFSEMDLPLRNLSLSARFGRQAFTDGSDLLLSQRDNGNLSVAMDGSRAWVLTYLRADFFDFRYTRYGPKGPRDDVTDRSTRFSGVTTGIVLPQLFPARSALTLDPFI